ncbi:hypothetical protein SLS62_000607 [Diatrype stigma]|uniref:Peptidase M43 pregnancy-associated plasma-A domain-containing protein n=1 Tax=Diatrype stigma TaxID=117547 RepID=A0AAN9YWV3_9PEZI
MHPRSWATTAAFVLSAQGSSAASSCGNEGVIPEPMPAVSNIVAQQAENVTVDVYFHIGSTEANKDRITEDLVAAQSGATSSNSTISLRFLKFQVLHDVYLPYGFEFRYVNTSWVVDDVIGTGFYQEGDTIEDYDAYVAHLNATRRGGYDALNLYFFTDLPPSLGGQCNFPRPVAGDNDYNVRIDGCIVNGDTMPGMFGRNGTTQPGPRQGKIAVHETGHWFNLLHTFNGAACNSINDQVADTPAQAGATIGCPASRDSCPDSEGLDPIHNFMDYSDDDW